MVHSPTHFPNTLSAGRTVTHHSAWLPCGAVAICWLFIAPAASSWAAASNFDTRTSAAPTSTPTSNGHAQCLPTGDAYLRARLTGAIDAELSWTDSQLNCAGSVRPNGEGIRLRFAAIEGDQARLVLLFGITGLQEGKSGKALPVNLTIMREGSGEFYGTQGDNKCTIDDIRQEPLQGIPLRQRAYRIVARGFCTQPARALNGDGSILVTRFDFAGRADFVSDDEPPALRAATLPTP